MADNTRLIALAVIGGFAILAVSTCEVRDTGDSAVASQQQQTAPAPVTPPPPPALTAADIALCRSLMAKAQSLGVVKKVEQNLSRLTVDEPSWKELGPDGRRTLMGTAACDWFGAPLTSLSDAQRVTIISWQSGDRIASSMGGTYAGD